MDNVNPITLASLALLKANMEKDQRDVLDMLTPLVEFAGGKRGLKAEFSTSELKSAVEEELGLILPERVLELILGRLQRRGSAKRQSGLYSVEIWRGDPAAIEETRAQLVRRYGDVVEHLRSFVSDRYKVPWSAEEARNALDRYIDTYSIECIKAHAAASPVPVHGESPKNAGYLVSSYVNDISKRDSQRFELLIDAVKGRMLANAVLGEDLVDQKQGFKGTTLFLDTPLVLRLLGFSGAAAEQLVVDIIELGSKAGVSWAVFEHTVEESDAVMRGVQRNLEYSYHGHGDVYLHAKDAGYSASDVTLLRSRLPDLLGNKHVSIEPTPCYISDLQIDEKALETECSTAGLRHGNKTSLLCDINSIRSIYVIRKHARPRKLEDSHAALVTSNAALARAAFSYGKRHEASREVSTVVTEYSLANLLWLKWPLQAPAVPKHVLAASCQATLRPSPELWRSFLDEAEKLQRIGKISPEQHAFLRFESKVRADLMELTLGDETALSSDTVLQLISAYEEEVARPYKRELDSEKTRRENAERALEDSRQTEKRLQQQLARAEERRNRVKRSASWWAKLSGYVVASLIAIVGVLLLLAGLIWQLPTGSGWISFVPNCLLVLAGGYAFIFSLLNLVLGVTLRTPVAWLRGWVERRIYTALAKKLEVDDGMEESEKSRC